MFSFHCKSDGICLDPKTRCDGSKDCPDNSDEINCGIILANFIYIQVKMIIGSVRYMLFCYIYCIIFNYQFVFNETFLVLHNLIISKLEDNK